MFLESNKIKYNFTKTKKIAIKIVELIFILNRNITII